MKTSFLIIAILIIGICTWLTLTDRWIAPAINNWQASITGDGSYFPKLTIIILAVPPLAMMAIWKRIQDKKQPKP
ncbi:MAG: hypothetical protein NTW29_22870 [Bacteroidetes bacterium]|nr:hypothetical protein [Bacteroidota bacterium]